MKRILTVSLLLVSSFLNAQESAPVVPPSEEIPSVEAPIEPTPAPAEVEPADKPFPTFTSKRVLEPTLVSCTESPFCGTFDPTSRTVKMTDVLEFSTTEPVDHKPNVAVQLQIKCSAPMVVGLEVQNKEGAVEVYRRLQLVPGENNLYWLMEERIGKSINPQFFLISLGGTQPSEFKDLTLELVSTDQLSNKQLLAATQFEAFQVAYKEINLEYQVDQLAHVTLPRELYRRFLGQTISVTIGAELQNFLIDPTVELKKEFFYQQFPFIADDSTLGKVPATASIIDENNQVLLELGSQQVNIIKAPVSEVGSFEIPFRDALDYVPFFQEEDLRLITIPRDQLSKVEPFAYESCRHEILDYTISLKSLHSREHVGWRAPSVSHFAESGFQQLGIGIQPIANVFFIPSENANEQDSLAYGVSVDDAPFGAPVDNPLYAPSAEWTGAKPTDSLNLVTTGAQKYGSAYFMLNQVQVNNGPARMISAFSNDLRAWVETGLVPELDRNPNPAKHLFLTQYRSIYYLIRDREVWISQDPFRSWSKISMELPLWANVRLVQGGDQWYFFGMEVVHEKQVVRWQKCEWKINPTGFFIPEIIPSP